MQVKPDRKEIESICEIKNHAAFKNFLNFLEKELDKERKQCENLLKISDMRISQGKRRMLSDILSMINDSEKILQAMVENGTGE